MENTKKYHILYGIIMAALIVIMIAGGFVMQFMYRRSLNEKAVEYKASKKQYDEAYARVIEEEQTWKSTLAELQENLNTAYTELDDIYSERQAEIDAEAARWKALSAEEQAAETKCIEYNEAISELRKTNKEYADIYTQYAEFIDKDIFNLGKEDMLRYTELYQKKVEIEKNFMNGGTEDGADKK